MPVSCPQTHSTPSDAPGLPGSGLCWEMGSRAPNNILRIGPVAGSAKRRVATERDVEIRLLNPVTDTLLH